MHLAAKQILQAPFSCSQLRQTIQLMSKELQLKPPTPVWVLHVLLCRSI